MPGLRRPSDDPRADRLPAVLRRGAGGGRGGRLIPLGELPKRVNELDSAEEIVAHCKSEVRRAKAVDFLKKAGFRKVRNLRGGILAWSDKVDPSVPKY